MTEQEQANLRTLATELGDDVTLIKDVVRDYKDGGIKNVLAKDGMRIALEAREDFAAFRTALPTIKSGWKTSEFWLIILFSLGNVVFLAWKGTPIPTEVNVALGAVVAAYTVMRGFAKKTPPPANVIATVPAATPPAGT